MRINWERFFLWSFVATALVSLFAFAENPINPAPQTDSSVFFYIGTGMREGLVPYRDMFDHKGPLIYFLNFFGACLTGDISGVWIIESALYLASLAWLFAVIRRWDSAATAYLACLAYICLFFILGAGGNMTESYAVCFILPTWLSFMEDVKHKDIRKRTSFMAGVTAGVILMLRPNMFGICVPIGCFIAAHCWQRRDWGLFARHSCIVLAGLLAVLLPLASYAFHNGIFGDMYDCYVQFNLNYASSLRAKIDGWILFPIITLALNGMLLAKADDGWRIPLAYNLVFTLATTGLIVLKLQYPHYYLSLLPCAIIPVVVACKQHPRMKTACYGACVLLGGIWAIYSLTGAHFDLHAIRLFVTTGKSGKSIFRTNQFTEILELRNHLPDESSVLVLGNQCHVYRLLGARSNSRYFYHTPALKSKISDALSNRTDPHVIIHAQAFKDFEEPLTRHYARVYQTDTWSIWQASDITRAKLQKHLTVN